jgi:PAS domain S-box-containing protein
MQRALRGETGIMIGPDRFNVTTLSAYEPIPELNLGLVAKIDMSEIQRPYLESGLQAGAVGVAVAMLVAVCFMLYITPLVRGIERSNKDAHEANRLLAREIVERRGAMEELAALRVRLDIALDATKAGFWVWFPLENRVHLGRSFYTMLDYEPDAFPATPENMLALAHPDDASRLISLPQGFTEDNDEFVLQFRQRRADGAYRWISSRGKVFERNEDHLPTCVIGIQIDITEQVERELMLKDDAAFQAVLAGLRDAPAMAAEEEIYRLLLELCLAQHGFGLGCLVKFDTHGSITQAFAAKNDGRVQPFYIPLGETSLHDANCPFLPAVKAREALLVSGIESLPDFGVLQRVANDLRCTAALYLPMHYNDSTGLILFGRNDESFGFGRADRLEHLMRLAGVMLEARARERKAFDTNAQLAMAIESMDDAVVITDTFPRIKYVNPAFEHLTGYSAAEVLGQNPNLLSSGQHDRAFYEEMWQTILSGKPWHGEMVNLTKDGRTVVEQAMIAPVRNAQGEITDFVCVKHDITEARNLQRQLRQAQKLESIGTLAGGIAHDFNNLLSVILGYSEILEHQLGPESPQYEDLEKIHQAGLRAKELVRQILTFSRMTEHASEPLMITPIIKEALKMLRATMPSSIRLIEDITPGSGLTVIDPTQMHQVIMNLCTNAAQAMGEGQGTITVQLHEMHLPKAEIAERGLRPADRYIELRVADTGGGVPEHLRERIFDPFFTTKEPGKGTGLGLATTHGIVTAAGGAIELEPFNGSGAVFRILLPVAKERAVDHTPFHAPQIGGTERILIVDDEADVAKVLARRLERRGYDAVWYADSRAAFDAFRQEPDNFDLVLTDQQMPGISGVDLLKQVRALRPDMPVAVLTGFSSVVTPDTFRTLGFDALVTKPVDTEDLLAAVHRALHRGSDPGVHPEARPL